MNEEAFQQILDRVARNMTEPTAVQYSPKIRDFKEWLDGKPMEEAGAIDVDYWLASLVERYQNASSENKGRAALVAAYTELNKLIDADRIEGEGWPHKTPVENATNSPKDTDNFKQKETRDNLQYLKPAQVDELADSTVKLRDELIVRLILQTGMRVTELCELRVENIDRDERSIRIRGKGRKNRTVWYQPDLDFLIDV